MDPYTYLAKVPTKSLEISVYESTPNTDTTSIAMRHRTKNLCIVAALVSLVVIISLANWHYFGRRYTPKVSEHHAHQVRRPPGVWLHGYPRKVTPVMVQITPKEEDPEPTEKLVPVSLHCKDVCTTGFVGDCYPLEKAILVYRDKVATIYMKFLQNAYPVIYVPQPIDERLLEVKEVEQCNMDDHFPDMFLIQRYKRCAVVGNSGILSGSRCGEAIDSHDFILRANMAPIEGYEDDVGHFTDLTAINWETLKRLYAAIVQSGSTNLDNRILLEKIHNLKKSILWYPKSLKKLYQREMIRKLAVTLKDHKYMDIHLAFSWKSISVEKEWGLEGYATLGFDIFAAARTFCSNITVYGFYPFNEGPNGQRVQHHYYEDMDFKYQTAKHDFLVEFRKLKNLDKKGEIKLQTTACSSKQKPPTTNQPQSGIH